MAHRARISGSDGGPLARFSPLARTWFGEAFAEPTPAQAGGWDAIASGRHTLVVAPTGSGKTLAAFLWAIDRLASAPPAPRDRRLRVLYVSPLKALAVDIERNLRSPLTGMQRAAARLGVPAPDISVALRTGDTPAEDRRRFARTPPDILITTPESLFLLLTSQAREALRSVETVIVDEVHAVAGTKRGAHLAVSLERLQDLLPAEAQRIGLSATVRPVDEVARFLGGAGRDVTIVRPAAEKRWELSVEVPVEDMSDPAASAPPPEDGEVVDGEQRVRLGPSGIGGLSGTSLPMSDAEERASVWPAIDRRLVELIRAHRSTIVFANSRRLAERLCARLNELAEAEIARAHHGSVSREQRLLIEEELKAGRLPAVVATSSLELGIDMAAVDLVIQVESPPSVASGLQRVGRSGHGVGDVSRGVIFPKFRGDLVECAVVVERMRAGAIEALRMPRNPLDVLAQQVVAMVAMEDREADDVEATVRRAAPFADLPRSAFDGVLDMLSGRYPSDEFAELRPRLNWDRIAGRLAARPGAQRLAVTSGGTIPDRGLFPVFIAGDRGPRVGELDEEMVYESRPGDVFILGTSSWRIEEITHDRVMVTPAPGVPGRMPFWKGDALGRPAELGRALGAFLRELSPLGPEAQLERLRGSGLDERAANNLIQYVAEQREATGVLPDDRTIVVERFRDELGDWRLCVHSPFGARVHTPWAQAIELRVRERLGLEVQTMVDDDGIVVRLPEADEAPPVDSVLFEPEEIEEVVTDAVGGSALFASRFRENAARALLLPRRTPGKRTPLWQQRQRSASLLQVASRYGSFPMILETFRECLQDAFDLPGLVDLMTAIRSREIRLVEVDTPMPSPFASALLFGYVAAFMYEGDAPLAERRAQALTLDRRVLAELLGRDELRELVDPGVLQDLELELQRLAEGWKVRDRDGMHDLLRTLGDLSTEEAMARLADPDAGPRWLHELEGERRAVRLRVAGEERWVAAEDAARFRDALGTALPPGLPAAFLEPVDDPVRDLVSRFARTHGPFTEGEPAARLGLGVAVVREALVRLEESGRVARGEFRPGGGGQEWVDVEVLRRLRRRSLAAMRKEAEPAPQVALARFLPAWHGIGRGGSLRSDPDAVLRVVEQLQGVPVPASVLERQVLGVRLPGYRPSALDELCAAGEVVWAGQGAIGSDDGWVALYLAESAPALVPEPAAAELSPLGESILAAFRERGAMFFRQVVDREASLDDHEVMLALWELAWAGLLTNDTLAPLRAMTSGGTRSRRRPSGRRGRPAFPSRMGPPAAAGRWSLLPEREANATVRLHAIAERLLARHGVLTRPAVGAERVTGGFAAVYPVLKAMEEAGRARRGYYVEGLGGAQFALPGAVDRLRALAEPPKERETLVLSACDPAQPYGAALAWPDRPEGHRPGRKAGAVVVLVNGTLALYVERGGRTVLSFTDEAGELEAATEALSLSVREGLVAGLTVERADGAGVFDSPLAEVLAGAGFSLSPRGLRLRG
jgi:ATP-dependent helicase Lhr and Lhr-like helicase